jgi:squalene-hopene/tetraprenyl-beta-curcumene cyclase
MKAFVQITRLSAAAVAAIICLSATPALSQQRSPEEITTSQDANLRDIESRETLRRIAKAGVDYLLEKGQADDGSFSSQLSPAVTALCLVALLDHGVNPDDPRMEKTIQFLKQMVQPDGGIYAPGSTLRNYETSVAILAFTRLNQDDKYDKVIQDAVAYLKGLQWDDGEGHSLDSTFYGGQGYGSHKRPDASNTSFFLDALKEVGEDADSVAMQKALTFMSRTQNLPSEFNTSEWASKVAKGDRGGFIYTAANGGESKAGESPTGGLRSYASMTYAGLKSLLYAGVSKDDIRVQAAQDWISRHYDLKSNPGMGQQGLFYYYHVFAKTLDATGQPTLVDSSGVKHDWRKDLISVLAEKQNKDGSWINPADRWYEGDPNLVTSYVLLALSYCDSE